ncbi:hypothetical protein BC829DRAFT_409832 [Chytridium lagenaria]|nr:hypothetical protein BC829DRAFT_409832 [Chytridium lagenaria]
MYDVAAHTFTLGRRTAVVTKGDERLSNVDASMGCDYVRKGIPVSYSMGGKVGKGFGRVPLWKRFEKEVTRAAIPLLYPAAFLERSVEVNKGKKGARRGGIGGGFKPRDMEKPRSFGGPVPVEGDSPGLTSMLGGLSMEEAREFVNGGKTSTFKDSSSAVNNSGKNVVSSSSENISGLTEMPATMVPNFFDPTSKAMRDALEMANDFMTELFPSAPAVDEEEDENDSYDDDDFRKSCMGYEGGWKI